ncbi:alpha/beta hydrolase [Streptosporangium sp. NPDC000396]|uniref:alpha/beta hydrolase n=1 Tax=Streptosporangium sp. NPDC000396 TaxID=3366185 RepID=UPI0036796F09
MIDVIASEWLKFRSLRSNLYLLAVSLLAVLLCAGIAFMITRGFDTQSAEEKMRFPANGDGLANGLPVAYFVFGALGALAITSEYATGMIRTSLVAVPRRQVFLLAKIPGLAAVALAAGQVLAFAMHFASQAVLGDRAGQLLLDGRTLGASLSEPGVLTAVVVAGLSMVAVALIGLGVGAAIRSTPGSLIALIMILFVLPVVAKTLPRPLGAQIGSFMIENLPSQIAGVGGGLLPPPAAVALLAAYTIAALTAGAVAITLKGRRIKVLAAGAAAIILAGAVPALADDSAAPASSTLAWKACPDKDVPPEMRCASIQVPVDWAKPFGRKITLPLGRLPATGTERRIGTVFSIPGGPGASGVDGLKGSAGSFTDLRERFDVVSFAPRNAVDLGVLSYECLDSGPWIFLPNNRAQYAALAKANRESAQRCRKADPEFFDHMDSASVARDIEAIRAALGEERLSFIATSYGGVPAVAYARLFPARVRAMVMDGIVNLLPDRAESDRMTYSGIEKQFERFTTWCGSTTSCELNGEDVGAVWRGLVAGADRSPIPVKGKPRQAAYTGFDLKVAAAPHLTSPGPEPEFPRWRQLAEAIGRARNGDASGFADYVEQGTGSLKVSSAVGANMTHCLDGMGYGSYEEYQEGQRRGQELSPNMTGIRQWHPLGCIGWPAPVTNPPRPLPARGLPPFLGVGTWIDFAYTDDLVRRVPGSSAVRYDGHGHGLYLTGNSCAIAHVNRYLTSLRLPPDGTVCRPGG